MQTDGIIPRPCRQPVTESIHEPTLVPQLPRPALGLLWKCSPHDSSSTTTPPSTKCHNSCRRVRCARNILPPEAPAKSASRLVPRSPQRHPTRPCVRMLLLLQKSEAKTRPLFFAFRNATVARPCRRSRTGSSGAAAHASQKATNSLSRFERARKCATGMLRVGWLPHGW